MIDPDDALNAPSAPAASEGVPGGVIGGVIGGVLGSDPAGAPPVDAVDLAAAFEGPAGTAAPRLIVKRSGAETDEVFPLHSPATIGRFDPAVGPIDVDLAPLPEGAYVSRKHARLTLEGDTWSITDLGSSNGTFVLKDGDFARVETSELADGDEIALGNARFVLRLT